MTRKALRLISKVDPAKDEHVRADGTSLPELTVRNYRPITWSKSEFHRRGLIVTLQRQSRDRVLAGLRYEGSGDPDRFVVTLRVDSARKMMSDPSFTSDEINRSGVNGVAALMYVPTGVSVSFVLKEAAKVWTYAVTPD